MQAKEFMQQVEQAEREMKLINARRRHFMELATGCGINLDKMPSSPNVSSKVENAAVAMADLKARLDKEACRYNEIIKKAEDLIAKIPQFKFRQVLTLRYLAGLSFKSVSDEMDYKSEKSVYLTHRYALQELQKYL